MPPLVVSLAMPPRLPDARLSKLAPTPITGEPDCGEPSLFIFGEFDCVEFASPPVADFHAENEPVNEPLKTKQLFPFWQDGP